MSNQMKNISQNVMEQIKQGRAKMKPKYYFVLGSVLTFAALISAIVSSVFLVGLIRFFMRSHGPRMQFRLDQIMDNFPWFLIIFAIVGLSIGIWLIRKYSFYYKHNPWLIITAVIVTIVVSGIAVDMTGINDVLYKQGPMKGLMKGYFDGCQKQNSDCIRNQ